MAGTDRNPTPPDSPPDGPGRSVAHGGEIEWAGGLIPTPPASGDVRVDPKADGDTAPDAASDETIDADGAA